MSLDLIDVEKAFRVIDWTVVMEMNDGETFGVVLDGQHQTVTKVHSDEKEDGDYDTDLIVVVEVSGQYFRKDGNSNIGSHCYGEYGNDWNSGLTEVRPKVVPTTIWE